MIREGVCWIGYGKARKLMQSLQDKIAVVAGATRGAGRGIACMLGEAGATVYCTGRSSRSMQASPRGKTDSPFALEGRPETIEETAEMVGSYGGKGIAVQVDHRDPKQVERLFERVRDEHSGRLDILVNDIWGGDELTGAWELRFWERDVEKWRQLHDTAIFTHIVTARYGVPLMIKQKRGLVIEITDGDSDNYRGNYYHDLVKSSVNRMAYDMAQELRPYGIASIAVTPGFLRSEAMLEHFGVTEANWREGAKKDPHFIASETPFYVGRAVAALASDPNVMAKTCKVLASWTLMREYGFTDIDGRQPDWGKYFAEKVEKSS